MGVNELLEEAAALREKGDARAAIEVLLEAHELDPADPFIDEQVAQAYDSIGQEASAIPHYERAIENGLDGEDRLHAFVLLSSSQRALGRYDDAGATIERCLGEFPDSRVAQTMQAMVRWNQGDRKGAFEQLLDLHAATSGDEHVRTYRGQLHLFAEDIDHVYE